MNDDLLVKRFWAKVKKLDGDGCWVWTGCCVNGYGVIISNRKPLKAHRLSYELFKGPIPAGFDVRHSCHNRACIKPDHLSVGTRAENMIDMMEAGRHRHGPVDPEIHSELMRRAWASYTPLERAQRVHKVSLALKDKPFTEEHLANLRASPANQKGRAPRAFGPQLPRTALNAGQVLIIRQKYAEGVKQEELGKEFGIGRAAIANIIRGITYKWVDGGGRIERQSGYGTKIKSEHSVHANTGKKRTEEWKRNHSEFMKVFMKEFHAKKRIDNG